MHDPFPNDQQSQSIPREPDLVGRKPSMHTHPPTPTSTRNPGRAISAAVVLESVVVVWWYNTETCHRHTVRILACRCSSASVRMYSQARKTTTVILCTSNQNAITQHLTSFIQASQAQLGLSDHRSAIGSATQCNRCNPGKNTSCLRYAP